MILCSCHRNREDSVSVGSLINLVVWPIANVCALVIGYSYKYFDQSKISEVCVGFGDFLNLVVGTQLDGIMKSEFNCNF